jgi:heme/copper-type cytochrome/quinol oxidase subunit 3
MQKDITSAGFMSPADHLGSERRLAAFGVQLATSIALVLSTLVAATAVARADVMANVVDDESTLFAIALLLGLFFIGIGSLTVLPLPHQPRRPETHR